MNKQLCAQGRAQADDLGKSLRSEGIEYIFCSDMIRAQQTAQIMNRHLSVPVVYRDYLREIDRGELSRHTREEVYAMFPDFRAADQTHDEDVPYPNGECGQDVWHRARQVFAEIEETGKDTVAVVCHAGTILSLICGALDIPQQKRFFLGYPPEFCSTSVLKKENGRYYLHQFNQYART